MAYVSLQARRNRGESAKSAVADKHLRWVPFLTDGKEFLQGCVAKDLDNRKQVLDKSARLRVLLVLLSDSHRNRRCIARKKRWRPGNTPRASSDSCARPMKDQSSKSLRQYNNATED